MPVERDRQVVLRELLVPLVVPGLALVDLVEAERSVAPLLAVEEALGLRRLLGHLPRLRRRRVVDHLRPGRRRRVELDLGRGFRLRRRRGRLLARLSVHGSGVERGGHAEPDDGSQAASRARATPSESASSMTPRGDAAWWFRYDSAWRAAVHGFAADEGIRCLRTLREDAPHEHCSLLEQTR